MEGFFSTDNILFRILNRICDIFVLHLIWVVCSIPIFTIGASTTALYYTAMKSVTLEDGYVAKRFFKSFKENFKQSTLIWLIMLGAGLILGADLYISVYMKLKPLRLVFAVLLCVYMFILIYVFPLQARFDNKISITIRNAFLLSVKYFPWTLLLVLINLLIAYLFYISPLFMIVVTFFGSSAYAYGTAFIFNKLFKPYMPEAATGSSDEEFHIKDDIETNANADIENDDTKEENTTETKSDDSTEDNSEPKPAPRKLSMAEKVNSVTSYEEKNEGRD